MLFRITSLVLSCCLAVLATVAARGAPTAELGFGDGDVVTSADQAPGQHAAPDAVPEPAVPEEEVDEETDLEPAHGHLHSVALHGPRRPDRLGSGDQARLESTTDKPETPPPRT